MKKLLILILTILLIIPLVTASGDYYYPSYDTKLVTGDWNSATTEDYNYQPLTNDPSWFTPLVGDLDNDGTNEIIIIDGDNVEIYQDYTLTPITGKSVTGNVQHAVLYDIDGDNDLEIITVGGTQASILSFNGTSLNLDVNHTINGSTGATTYQYMVGCKAEQDCTIINARIKTGSTESIYAMRLNTTSIYNNTVLKSSTGVFGFTLPKIRTISNGNMDGTQDVFVFSGYDQGNQLVCYWYVSTDTNSLVEEFEKCVSGAWVLQETGRDEFTSPLIGDFDPTEDGQEVVIAFQSGSTTEFQMYLYDSTGNELREYPGIGETDGTLISNPVRLQAFSDTSSYRDFCVMGYDTTENALRLLCGSGIASDWIAGETFTKYNITFDLDETDYYPTTILHAVQTDDTTTGGINLNEILTSYGVLSLTPDNVVDSDLDFEFQITETSQGIAIPSDVQQVDRFDILYQNDQGIFYFDDGFVNEQTVITNHGIDTGNPICEGVSAIKLNVTFTDDYTDTVTCWYEELEANETSKANSSNTSRVGSGTLNFYYNADELGAFFIDIYCTDGLHAIPDSERRDILVTNDTDTCNQKGEGAETTDLITPLSDADELADTEFESDIDAFLDGIQAESPKARNILAMIIVICIGTGVFIKSRSVELSLAGGMSGALIALIIGVMSILPFVIVIITSIALIVRATLSGRGV